MLPSSSSYCCNRSYLAPLLLGRVSFSRKMLDVRAAKDITAAERQGSKKGLQQRLQCQSYSMTAVWQLHMLLRVH